MAIFFTICANNYLPEALSLGKSLLRNGLKKDEFIIFLVDKKSPEIDYASFPFSVIPVDGDIVPGFENIHKKYRIVEFSTAVKPSIFKFLLKQYPTQSHFGYLDPDLFFFNAVTNVVQELGNDSILLTPHITKPVALDKKPFENLFLNYGIYNLGFLLIKADNNSRAMLDWWETRTLSLGYDQPGNGLFVDQLWTNHVPLFFNQVKVTKHPGLNCAFWNIHERVLSKKNDTYFVNENSYLIFFHFSSFDFSGGRISKGTYTDPDGGMDVFLDIGRQYKQSLIENNIDFYKKIKPAYGISFEKHMERGLPGIYNSAKVKAINKILFLLPGGLLRRISNLHEIVSVLKSYKRSV